MPTHEVTNQPPPLEGYDVYAADAVLREAVAREGAASAEPGLHALGTWAGSPEAIAAGFDADRCRPVLRSHDRFGHRVDEVDFHPAYHFLLGAFVGAGLAGAPWAEQAAPGAHVARAAGFLVLSQVDAGVGCPTSMTYAGTPLLAGGSGAPAEAALAQVWQPRLTSGEYEAALRPPADKPGVTIGMSMTEKQGGSDVRANATTAAATAEAGLFVLTGHKWFCSAPMSDGFLVTAQAPAGLTCFLLPRVLPDGTRNAVAIQRLKDKLGNRSNASSELEFDGALAWQIGPEGRGVRTMVDMVALTRLDCVIGSCALIRQAVAQAIHHATYRSAFGRRLVEQPLMTAVLADLAVESEAATTLALRLARTVDDGEVALRRIGTALGKYWVCKRAVAVTAEALECLGGNGYAEESIMPRLYREAPVNSVWEGSGNVNALDLLRVLRKEPDAVAALVAELDAGAGGDARLDALVAAVKPLLSAGVEQARARWAVERLAVALQGSLLVRHAPPAVADAFCATRIAGEGGATFGTLPSRADAAAIVERHAPVNA